MMALIYALAASSSFFDVGRSWLFICMRSVAYAADEWIRGLLMWRRWARHDWEPYARATHRRLPAAAL